MHSVKSSILLKLTVVAGLVTFFGGLAVGSTPAWAHDMLPSPDVSAFGDAVPHGSTSAIDLRAPVTGMTRTPDGAGYWEVAADGGVFSFGDAQFFGSMGAKALNQPVTGMAATPDGGGYWLVAADGGIFSFGDAQFFGSIGAKPLNQPVTGMTRTPDGAGYWLVAADGGIFSFGDAQFFGSMGAKPLNQPVTGMAATPDGAGYWLVAADGGIFSFGDAQFFGSMGAKALNQPVTGMAATPDGGGYWLVAADGGIFSFGRAGYFGSYGGGLPAVGPNYMRFVGLAPTVDGGGYWLVASGFCASPGTFGPTAASGSGSGVATLSQVTVAPILGCAEQVQFTFNSPAPSTVGFDVRYVTAPVASPSGLPMHVAGSAFLQVTLHPAESDGYTGPVDITSPVTSNIVEVRQTQNFEGYMTWIIGLAHAAPVWVGQPNPGASQTFVVDIG
jgi:hypothetical protein